MTSIGLSSISDVMAFHLYTIFAAGKDLSNDIQIRVIGSIEQEISSKMLGNLSEKLGAKFYSTTLGYYVIRISYLSNAFSGILELEASPVESEQQQQMDKKRRKRKGNKKRKPLRRKIFISAQVPKQKCYKTWC